MGWVGGVGGWGGVDGWVGGVARLLEDAPHSEPSLAPLFTTPTQRTRKQYADTKLHRVGSGGHVRATRATSARDAGLFYLYSTVRNSNFESYISTLRVLE